MIALNLAQLKAYRAKYQDELFDGCLPFWMEHSIDQTHGGIYNSLDRTGHVFSRDKSVWLQGRATWMFAHLCNQYGQRDAWQKLSESCLLFLKQYGADPVDGRLFFMLTEDGRPLRKRRYYFSEAFYIMACAEYASAFDAPDTLEIARQYYELIVSIYRDPTCDPYKITPKFYGQNRPMRAFAPSMILLNVSHVMARCDAERAERYEKDALEFTQDFIRYFYKPDLNALLETVGPNGEFMTDVSSGRTMNPGHAVEGAWFLIVQALKTGDRELLCKAEQIFRWSVERGWDKEHNGLFSFIDVLGHPPEQLEHNMKLWWPQCELLICALMLYEQTDDPYYLDWFIKADAYVFDYFKDPLYGEWYGYLTHDNVPAVGSVKGNLFKGPFHLPRMLVNIEKCLERLEAKAQ